MLFKEELDFVSYAEALGYTNPMYLPQVVKNCISKSLEFHKKEVDRLNSIIVEEEDSHTNTIDQRDNAQEWADKLAEAIADTFKVSIGEHSNVNSPWVNAHEYITELPFRIDVWPKK